jgi:anti-sigma-K factor RskA
MSLSHESARDDQLVRYLLGLLTEQEAEEIDALFVADDEMAGRLQALENDLIDEYVSGTLTGQNVQQFERVYLATPRRREKVRFAETLLQITTRIAAPSPGASREATRERSPVEVPTARGRPRARWYERLAWQPNTGWGLAMAATLLIAVVGGLQLRAMRLRAELQVVRTEHAALEQRARELVQQLGDQHAISAGAASELERIRGALAEAARTVPEQPGADPGVLAAMLLVPQMRSVGAVPTLVVPRRAHAAAFDLQLEPSDFMQFQVTLRDPATSGVLWRSARLTPVSSAGRRTVSLVVPVRVLQAQHYAFELAGVAPGGTADAIAGYAFRIVLR